MGAKMLLPLAALAFATWAVYLGGLAAVQSDCDTDNALTRPVVMALSIPCSKAYRIWWFYMALEFVLFVTLAMTVVSGKVPQWRMSIIGLFAIATVLFIETSNDWLNALQMPAYDSESPLYQGNTVRTRVRTLVAGAIMTATVNGLIVAMAGCTEGDSEAPAAAPKEAATV